jgi:hypothetical protein
MAAARESRSVILVSERSLNGVSGGLSSCLTGLARTRLRIGSAG